MLNEPELQSLLDRVRYRKDYNAFEGLDVFREGLRTEPDIVVPFLTRSFSAVNEEIRSGIAFVLAEHYRTTAQLNDLAGLFAIDDASIKASVLNALWEKGGSPEMIAGILRLALAGAQHHSAQVRIHACFVFQNQAGNGADVSAAVLPLLALLSDSDPGVRRQAAFATGNVAKSRYKMADHIVPLAANLADSDQYVREANAWALWQLSRSKHDIDCAISPLVTLLATSVGWDGPRKNAAGALLHHARKSPERAEAVRHLVRRAVLSASDGLLNRFLTQLSAVH